MSSESELPGAAAGLDPPPNAPGACSCSVAQSVEHPTRVRGAGISLLGRRKKDVSMVRRGGSLTNYELTCHLCQEMPRGGREGRTRGAAAPGPTAAGGGGGCWWWQRQPLLSIHLPRWPRLLESVTISDMWARAHVSETMAHMKWLGTRWR
jgi:hypothetical protein